MSSLTTATRTVGQQLDIEQRGLTERGRGDRGRQIKYPRAALEENKRKRTFSPVVCRHVLKQ
jgi:hypothetical protein